MVTTEFTQEQVRFTQYSRGKPQVLNILLCVNLCEHTIMQFSESLMNHNKHLQRSEQRQRISLSQLDQHWSIGMRGSFWIWQRFILNMDQTLFFNDTIKNFGEMRVSDNYCVLFQWIKWWATVALTVTASGLLLPPLFVFKGKEGGRIECGFSRFQDGAFYSVQDHAWMDERMTLVWVAKVL